MMPTIVPNIHVEPRSFKGDPATGVAGQDEDCLIAIMKLLTH